MRIFYLLGLVLLLGCASSPQRQARPVSPSADAAFARLAEDYIAGHLAWRPQEGVSLGLHEYDGRLTDYSPASWRKERARLRRFDRQLSRIKESALSREAQGDCRILRTAVAKERFEFEDLRSYQRNPMTYAGALAVDVYIKRDFAPLEQRTRSIIAVLRQAPRVMAAARANLEESLPKPWVETAIEIAEGSASFLAGELVQALKDSSNPALQAEFVAVNQVAIAELRGYVTYLKEQKLPQADDAYALGSARFGRMLRDQELVDLDPDSILRLGQRELLREQQVFARTARLIDPTKSPIEVFRAIQKDHPTAANLIPDTRQHLEAIREFMTNHHLITLPAAPPPRVEETPEFDRATSFASMDAPGPFETKATEAYYYVTPVETHWPPQQQEEWLTAFNYYTTDVVSIHEVYPGHYAQALALSASGASRLRKIFSSYAFVEGWAHYTEQMMLDEGFGQAPAGSARPDALRAAKYRLAQSDEALLRLCRLCVAIRMHCHGLTVERATEFFRENCYYEEKPARQEAIRGAFDPGYLHYTLGKLMLLKLRADWRRQEGADYSPQRFHDELLRHGQPPIRLLRQWMLKDSATWNDLL